MGILTILTRIEAAFESKANLFFFFLMEKNFQLP